MWSEPFDPASFAKLGLAPARTIEVRWQWDGRAVTYRAEHGVIPKIVAGRHYLAALVQLEADPATRCKLLVLNGDGSVRFTLPDTAKTPRGVDAVEWVSFESMKPVIEDHFAAIADVGDGQWAFIVDAASGGLMVRGEAR
jgi:nitrogen fixation protein FixH